MLKKETIKLISSDNPSFMDILSISVGKVFVFEERLKDHIGNYAHINALFKQGELYLDDKLYLVQFMGSTSPEDNCWFSSEIEKVIPDYYKTTMVETRKTMERMNYKELMEKKIPLHDDVNGDTLAIIYTAFAEEDTAYFCGVNNISLYMYIDALPDKIFEKITSSTFCVTVPQIISKYSVNHKIMVKALLIENDIEYEEQGNNIVAKFRNGENSDVNVLFDDLGRIKRVEGSLKKQ